MSFDDFFLDTERLRLHAATSELLRCDLSGGRRLGRALNASVPRSWPPPLLEGIAPTFLELLEQSPEDEGWLGWYWVKKADMSEGATLVAMGGFKGAPDANGAVEIGYSMLGPWQGLGLTTEAVAALTRWAFTHREVRQVVARVLPHNIPSIRVLEKCAYSPSQEVDEEGHLVFRCERGARITRRGRA